MYLNIQVYISREQCDYQSKQLTSTVNINCCDIFAHQRQKKPETRKLYLISSQLTEPAFCTRRKLRWHRSRSISLVWAAENAILTFCHAVEVFNAIDAFVGSCAWIVLCEFGEFRWEFSSFGLKRRYFSMSFPLTQISKRGLLVEKRHRDPIPIKSPCKCWWPKRCSASSPPAAKNSCITAVDRLSPKTVL